MSCPEIKRTHLLFLKVKNIVAKVKPFLTMYEVKKIK